jgi:hypothetical protein
MDQGFVALDPGKDDILPIFTRCDGWLAQGSELRPGDSALSRFQAQTLGSPEYFRVPKGLTGDAELMAELVGIGWYAQIACEHEQAGQTSIDVLGWLRRLFRCHSWFALLLGLREHLRSLLTLPMPV